MFKLQKNSAFIALCCDVCGEPVVVDSASFAGPFSDATFTADNDAGVLLVHNECESRAHTILQPLFGNAFGTVSAAESLRNILLSDAP